FPPVAGDALGSAVDPSPPLAEVVDLAPDLLLPDAPGVGCERELGVGLWRTVGRFTPRSAISRLGHGATSSAEGTGSVAPAAAIRQHDYPQDGGRRAGRKARDSGLCEWEQLLELRALGVFARLVPALVFKTSDT